MNGIQAAPATAETGFILTLPPSKNAFTSDIAFQRILDSYLPPEFIGRVHDSLTSFAEEARSPTTLAMISDAEKNVPYVRTHDSWGKRFNIDQLVTTQGWKHLGKWGASRGVIATGYDPEYREYRRIVQFAKTFIYGPASALYSCPFAMTDGAARLLHVQTKGLPHDHPLCEAYRRLTATENHWTSGQWMTERPGGSDVQNTETWARYAPLSKKTGEHGRLDEGDWLVSGFKYFSSATDANVAILLAKTESGKLAAFLAPLVKTVVNAQGKEQLVTNGIRIHRLKIKLGTKQLPTAELELKDVRAHLLGPVDRGVATISVLLNVTRVHTYTGVVAGLSHTLAVAKLFAEARTTFGQPLWKNPLHLRTLADIELKRRALLHLANFTTALMGFVESGFPAQLPPGLACLPKPGKEAEVVLRVQTATAKAVCSKVVVGAMQECMEAMGGVGYIDDPDDAEHNVARPFRDTLVNTIWEGTTNVMSSELLRFMLSKDNLDFVSAWLSRNIAAINGDAYRNAVQQSWRTLYTKLETGKRNIPEALGDGRRAMFSFAWIVCSILLVRDAERDGDSVAQEAARRWVLAGEGGVGEWVYQDVVRAVHVTASQSTSQDRLHWDSQLVFGGPVAGEIVSKI